MPEPTTQAMRAVAALKKIWHSVYYTPAELAEIVDRETRLPALIEALRFYADKDTYRNRGIHMGGGGDSAPISGDRGRRARAALQCDTLDSAQGYTHPSKAEKDAEGSSDGA